MQEMQDLNKRNYAIPTMLIDDNIRQIEQKQEANVAILKNTNWKTKWTKSKVNILRLVVQSLSEYSSLIQELLLLLSDDWASEWAN